MESFNAGKSIIQLTARGTSVNVHFILDTGAPTTYIALSVLEAWGVPELSLPSEVVRINGVKATVRVSDTATVTIDGVKKPCHFVGLNILGMDAVLTIRMADNTIGVARSMSA